MFEQESSASALTENPLSEREMDVAQLLVTGASNVEIARELVISPHTVKVHLRNIYEKLEVNSRTEASMVLLKRGWLTVPGMPAVATEEKEAEIQPEPEPLSHGPGQMFAWQPAYLVGVVALFVLLLVLPTFTNRLQALPNLLSDRVVTAFGQPEVQELPRWESRTPLPKPRSRLALALSYNQMFAIGGETIQGQLLADVDAYDLDVNEWHAVSPLPIPLSNAAATTWKQRIYVAGGTTQAEGNTGNIQVSDKLWIYDPKSDSWTEGGSLPRPLAGAALVTAQDALYLLGGWDGKAMQDEMWRMSLQQDAQGVAGWELITHLDGARAFLGATVVNDLIYVVGGYDGKQELDTAQTYSLSTGEWSDLPPMSTPRGGLSVVYDGLAVLALGGGWTQAIDNHERYDPATGLWSNFPSPISGEWRHMGVVSENGRLHLLGGWSGSYLSTHLQYQSSFRTFLPLNKKQEPATTLP